MPWDKKRKEIMDPDNRPEGYKYWDERCGRWRKQTPEELADWIMRKRRFKHILDDKSRSKFVQ